MQYIENEKPPRSGLEKHKLARNFRSLFFNSSSALLKNARETPNLKLTSHVLPIRIIVWTQLTQQRTNLIKWL